MGKGVKIFGGFSAISGNKVGTCYCEHITLHTTNCEIVDQDTFLMYVNNIPTVASPSSNHCRDTCSRDHNSYVYHFKGDKFMRRSVQLKLFLWLIARRMAKE